MLPGRCLTPGQSKFSSGPNVREDRRFLLQLRTPPLVDSHLRGSNKSCSNTFFGVGVRDYMPNSIFSIYLLYLFI